MLLEQLSRARQDCITATQWLIKAVVAYNSLTDQLRVNRAIKIIVSIYNEAPESDHKSIETLWIAEGLGHFPR